MNSAATAITLALAHVSLIALVAIGARVVVGKRRSSARAMVGSVGMGSLLFVTAVAWFPLPDLWQTAEDGPAKLLPPATISVQADAQREILTSDDSETVTRLPTAWLKHLYAGVGQVTSAAQSAPAPMKSIFLEVLIGGAVLGMVRWLLGLGEVWRLEQKSEPVLEAGLLDKVREFGRRSGYERPIVVQQSRALATAATYGVRRAVIMLPSDWRTWSEEELDAALAHEVAHIRRGDFSQRALAQLCAALYFFHPLVRYCAWRVAVDQEFATDQLARGLGAGGQAYVRGLARLALRHDASISSGWRWASVSLPPRSSDFLARRLEMLRKQKDTSGERRGWFFSACAASCVGVIALATATLRSPVIAAEGVVQASSNSPVATAKSEQKGESKADMLFARGPFDISRLPEAKYGAYLIRVGELLRNPEFAAELPAIQKTIDPGRLVFNESFGLSDIDWIAGDIQPKVNGPGKHAGHFMLFQHYSIYVIHLNKARDWQSILKSLPGAQLVNQDGHMYVQLPETPYLGLEPFRARFPDNQTIVLYSSRTNEAELSKLIESDLPAANSYSWMDAWRASDGGFFTIAFDNKLVGWDQLPEKSWGLTPEERKIGDVLRPLAVEGRSCSLGLDWTDDNRRAGTQFHCTYEKRESNEKIRLGATSLVNLFCNAFLKDPEVPAESRQRVGRFFSNMTFEGPTTNQQPYIHVQGETPVESGGMLFYRAIFQPGG